MPLQRVRLYQIRLPFTRRYTHALADRTESDGLILEVQLENGSTGYGEALPREYVTGETVPSVARQLRDYWSSRWRDIPTESLTALAAYLESALAEAMEQRTLAAYGAVELALMDAVGTAMGTSVSTIFPGECHARIHHTGPIGTTSVSTARRLALLMRLAGLRDVKVKVGFPGDLATVTAVRKALGPRVNLRVDANGAWTSDQAIEMIHSLTALGVTSVEQPVARDDLDGLAAVQAVVSIPLVADESACTVADVERLASRHACRMINVRVGKCGGLLGAHKVAQAAERAGLDWHIGCLVGETALLSAAGRHFAFGTSGWRYMEGAYGPFLLQRDIASPQPRWGWRGSAKPLRGPGLGVRVDASALAAITTDTHDLL